MRELDANRLLQCDTKKKHENQRRYGVLRYSEVRWFLIFQFNLTVPYGTVRYNKMIFTLKKKNYHRTPLLW
jgi:hypothetical protein